MSTKVEPKNDGVVVYYRVSTTRQGRSGLGLEAQQASVESYLSSTGKVAIQSYKEIESGKTNSRLELNKAIQTAKAYRVPLVVAKIDRLSRNAAFLGMLKESGVAFVAADMPDANNLTVGIMALMAEHEAQMISTRTKDALKAAKARGVKLGGYRGGAAPSDEARKAAIKARNQKANARAGELSGIVSELRDVGLSSLRELARELSRRNVPTARGGHAWNPMMVKRLLDRQDKLG